MCTKDFSLIIYLVKGLSIFRSWRTSVRPVHVLRGPTPAVGGDALEAVRRTSFMRRDLTLKLAISTPTTLKESRCWRVSTVAPGVTCIVRCDVATHSETPSLWRLFSPVPAGGGRRPYTGACGAHGAVDGRLGRRRWGQRG